jgi:hypothetical protein
MGGVAPCGRKRKFTSSNSATGGVGSSAAAAVVVGSWVKTEKKLKSQRELLVLNMNSAEAAHLKIIHSP